MTPCRGKCRSPQTQLTGLVFQFGNTSESPSPNWWPPWHRCYFILLLWKHRGSPNRTCPGLQTHRSESTDFFLAPHGTSAVFAEASFVLVRSQEREDKHCKVKRVLKRVRSRSNRVNMEIWEGAGTKWKVPFPLPKNLSQKFSAACISSLSNLGFAPEAVDTNSTSSHFSPLSHAGALSCCLKQALKLPE